MSEIIQGFLASIGAALFFTCILATLKPIISSWRPASEEDDASGAPEGDLVHFRMAENELQREVHARLRRRPRPFGWRSGARVPRHSADGHSSDQNIFKS